MCASTSFRHPRWRALRSLLLVTACTFWLAGCWPEDIPTELHEGKEPVRSLEPATGPAVLWTFDDEMAAMVERLPGFAGIHLDPSGRLVVRLTDPARFAEAAVPIEDLLSRVSHRGPEMAAERAELVAGMRVEPADYDFRQLLRWYRGWIVPNVLGSPGVTLGDINEARNRIVIGVLDEPAVRVIRAAVEALPIPGDATVVEVIEPMIVARSTSDNLQGEVRPVIGGVWILGCTLGYNLTRVLSNGSLDGERYFVTNSHCTQQFGAVTGVTATQPPGGGVIGTEIVDPPLFTSVSNPQCPPGRQCRYSDAALFKYNETPWTEARIAWPNLGTAEPHPFTQAREVGGSGDPIMDMTVYKVGRTTGRTSGTVTEICTHVPQLLPGGIDTGITLLCQGRASYYAEGGDSGSPVVSQVSGSNVWIVERGINWSQGTNNVFSLGQHFRSELQAVMGGALHTTRHPVVQINGPSVVPPGVLCQYTSTLTGGTSPISYQWSGLGSGTSSSTLVWIQNSGWLNLDVFDAGYRSANYTLFVTVDSWAPVPPECAE